ncbi:MAG TPA: hypothetical protein DDW52_23595 [Planctomycetaceae bacterium]|nr:hypothetical protein [Planctomycetaceae bacterium]
MILVPEKAILRASQWCYRGIWGLFTQYMLVPDVPPSLSGADDQQVTAFRPADGFLSYLKLFFWIGLFLFDGIVFILWIVLLVNAWKIGLILTPLIWAIMIIPDIVAYIAIHLRYDTTWYVLSDRSMRMRRGIWIIHETTITYENIQNISIRQGPIQRHFGITDVVVDTAGGGATGKHGESQTVLGHSGLLEGVSNSEEIRSLLLTKWQDSRSGGLGDETDTDHPSASGFTTEQVGLLEDVRNLAVRLVSR